MNMPNNDMFNVSFNPVGGRGLPPQQQVPLPTPGGFAIG